MTCWRSRGADGPPAASAGAPGSRRRADIARVLGIDPKTLRKHYRDELDTGHVIANAEVAGSLFRKATGDGRQSVTAAIFWLETRAGWKKASRPEAAAGAQAPVVIEFVRFSDDAADASDTPALPAEAD